MRRLLIAILAVGLLAVGAAGAWGWSTLESFKATPIGPDPSLTRTVEIARGSHLGKISRQLAEAGLLRPERARWLELYGRHVRKVGGDLKAGEYEVSAGLTPDALLDLLVSGKVKTYRFTVPEGLNLWEIAPVVAESGLVDRAAFLAWITSEAAARELGLAEWGAKNLEGYLFPDTYFFPKGVDEKDVARAMVARFRATFSAELQAEGKALGLSPHQVVTLASIVEKETGAPDERPRISAVFHNRLKEDWLLQTDPTVIYAVMLERGGDFDGNIKREHLRMDHPYSTYARKGLPPGPIANPGRAALEAAVRPLSTREFFFVSRNDGTHIFCPDLACHNEAVRKWQVEFFRGKPR